MRPNSKKYAAPVVHGHNVSDLTGTLPVTKGGTGVATLHSGGVIVGNGAAGVTATDALAWSEGELTVTGDVTVSGTLTRNGREIKVGWEEAGDNVTTGTLTIPAPSVGAHAANRQWVGAAQTLRSLSLKSLTFGSSEPDLTAVYWQLARCTRLEQLWWDVTSDPEQQQGSFEKTPYRGALHDLISIVAAAAPRLTSIASPYQSSWSCKLAASALQELHRRREREATGPAWAVVKVGLEQAQERRVRGAVGLLSPLFRLPWSVLRRLGEYLDAAPLPLNIITDTPGCYILHPFEDILGHSLFVGAALL